MGPTNGDEPDRPSEDVATDSNSGRRSTPGPRANPGRRASPDEAPTRGRAAVEAPLAVRAPSAAPVGRRRFLLAAGVGTATVALVGGGALVGDRRPSHRSGPGDGGRADGAGVVVAPPVRGEWRVTNPPGHPTLADDFVGMRSGSRLPYPASSVPRHLLSRLPADRAFGWDRPVYAPIGGTVVEASGDEPDAEDLNLVADAVDTLVAPPSIEDGDVRPAAGNYVVIESDDGIEDGGIASRPDAAAAGERAEAGGSRGTVVAFLAHFRRGSVTVAEGDRVVPGQLLGAVGNSGASLFPHLHFQLMAEWTTDASALTAVLRPYRFARYEVATGNRVTGRSRERVRNRKPEAGDRIRVGARSGAATDPAVE